jgi:hypothetical protein
VIRELAQHLPDYVESLRKAASRPSPTLAAPRVATRRHHLGQLRKEANSVMRAIQQGRLQGRALEEALSTYQRLWAQVEQVEHESQSAFESAPIEIHSTTHSTQPHVGSVQPQDVHSHQCAALPKCLRKLRLLFEFRHDTHSRRGFHRLLPR